MGRQNTTGEAALRPGPAEKREDTARPPTVVLARELLEATSPNQGAVVIMHTERRAEDLARALVALGVEDGLVLPAWDVLPYDRLPPSRDVMGRRMHVLAELSRRSNRIVITSPAAILPRLPPERAAQVTRRIGVGDQFDGPDLLQWALAAGYVQDDRVDEPGEIACLGEVVDIYPAAMDGPVRLQLNPDGRVGDIRPYDPVSQRSLTPGSDGNLHELILSPASERVALHLIERTGDGPDDPEGEGAFEPASGSLRLEDHYGALDTLFDRMAERPIFVEAGALQKAERRLAQAQEAYEASVAFSDEARPPAPAAVYADPAALAKAGEATLLSGSDWTAVPRFARSGRRPVAAVTDYIDQRLQAGWRVVLCGLDHELRAIQRRLGRRLAIKPEPVGSLSEGFQAGEGALVRCVADLEAGFEDAAARLALLAASDILGGRTASPGQADIGRLEAPELRPGDVVIHEDHGLGKVEGLERVPAGASERDVLRLSYHGGASLLVPIEELGRVWRYGGEPAGVTLDRLNGRSWPKRRAEISTQIDAVAQRLVEMARERASVRLDPLEPPAGDMQRFAEAFAHPETPDQSSAIAAVLEDLASGRSMNRLVCGDVGFGKTEVALRAAAAVVFAGRQVVIAAPTTVLAGQHFETVSRRFRPHGIEVALLSRVSTPAEARAARDGAREGRVRVLVGTHALAADLVLAEPGLVVIDEEHRFGAELKDALSALAPHRLVMTATPIPRTLQSAMVGVQDVSVIATPPARRRPVRTVVAPFDGGSIRTALLRERDRAGQSFVVVPRVEEIEPTRRRLETLVPELRVSEVHGRVSAETVDDVLLQFARGEGDILLATNIIETGLDVPRANTMLILGPERFGLAQLHQLRGRVGRGARQGVTYLLTDPDRPLPETAQARLATLTALDRLGAGFAISARDLDLRGGGDLAGDDQAGHVRLIGAGLYQDVLARATRRARGEDDAESWAAPLAFEGGGLPEAYIPDEAVRLHLYSRLARAGDVEDVDALHEEILDRFGPLPEMAELLIDQVRLAVLARAAGVVQLTTGPKATAFTVAHSRLATAKRRLPADPSRRWTKDRLIVSLQSSPHDPAFLEGILSRLAA